jgi:ketosteroid isomerase-like protein
VILDYAVGGELLERWAQAMQDRSGDELVALFDEDGEWIPDPFEPPIVGHIEIRRALLDVAERAEQVEFTIERHWVVPPTVLASWHASYVLRAGRSRDREAGFTTLELGDDGLIRRARSWYRRQQG